MTLVSYENGIFSPSDTIAIPLANDGLGSVRGMRIFTSLVVLDNVPFMSKKHTERLIDNAHKLGINTQLTATDIDQLLHQTAKQNHESAPYLMKAILTGGAGIAPNDKAQLYILTSPLTPHPDSHYENGVKLATFAYQRPIADVKLTFYLGSQLSKSTVAAQNAHYPLFIAPNSDTILEGDTFNIFFVKDGHLETPKLDGTILSGITRLRVIEFAKQHNMAVSEKEISLSDLSDYQEAFITSSTRDVMPVSQIDSHKFPTSPGPVTQTLMAGLNFRTTAQA